MKKSKEFIKIRRKNLLLIINEKKKVSNVDLASELNISLPTLRRDIDYLLKKGLILKSHGYVQAMDTKYIFTTSLEKKRNAIAKYAATLINNDDTIFINSSETSIKTLQYIDPSKYVSVITNNGNVLNTHTLPNVKIILTGGEVKFPKPAMIGEFALKNIITVQANKAFLGTSGFHLEYGIGQKVEEISNSEVNIGAGTMYGTLSKMQKDGLIKLLEKEDNRKIYQITDLGQEVLEIEIKRIDRLYKNSRGERYYG